MMKKDRLQSLALIVSLIVNAFLAGYMLSALPMRGHPHGPPDGPPLDRMEMAADHLPDPYRQSVQALIADNRADMEPHRDAIHQNMEKIEPILTAPTFDKAALLALRDDFSRHDAVLKDGFMNMAIAIATALPDEQRIKFFKEISPGRSSMRRPGPDRMPPR